VAEAELNGSVTLTEHYHRVSGQWRTQMLSTLLKLIRNEDGATAIEYGLIAALIAVAAVTVLGTVGTNLTATFSTVASKL
jgi:pilus assembly protein Flp/PilA